MEFWFNVVFGTQLFLRKRDTFDEKDLISFLTLDLTRIIHISARTLH